MDTDALEAELAAMTDDELRRFYLGLEVDDPRCDIAAGECERRDIDL